MKKILILGVNGFIGHHLSQRIIAKTDWEVYGMDMQTERISDLMDEKRFHFFEGGLHRDAIAEPAWCDIMPKSFTKKIGWKPAPYGPLYQLGGCK